MALLDSFYKNAKYATITSATFTTFATDANILCTKKPVRILPMYPGLLVHDQCSSEY